MIPQRKLADVQVGALSYGLMLHTWTPNPTTDEQAFEAIKLAVDNGMNFLNSGEFYGMPEPTMNLELLSRFYAKYPDYVDKTVLSVKGAISKGPDGFVPDSSDEALRRSVEHINRVLKHKKMDLFEPARVDKRRSIEDVMKSLDKLRQEGHFKYIGLSEMSAETLRRAVKIAPVAAVEVEYSPWELAIEKNGILDACKELGVAIAAYSPLGKGMLTGKIKSFDDLPEGDLRRHFDRFQPENFANNYKIVEEIEKIAKKKGVTNVQLCLAWLLHEWEGVIPIPGTTRPAGVQECIDAASVKLTDEEYKELRHVIDNATIIGLRYNKHSEDMLEG